MRECDLREIQKIKKKTLQFHSILWFMITRFRLFHNSNIESPCDCNENGENVVNLNGNSVDRKRRRRNEENSSNGVGDQIRTTNDIFFLFEYRIIQSFGFYSFTPSPAQYATNGGSWLYEREKGNEREWGRETVWWMKSIFTVTWKLNGVATTLALFSSLWPAPNCQPEYTRTPILLKRKINQITMIK